MPTAVKRFNTVLSQAGEGENPWIHGATIGRALFATRQSFQPSATTEKEEEDKARVRYQRTGKEAFPAYPGTSDGAGRCPPMTYPRSSIAPAISRWMGKSTSTPGLDASRSAVDTNPRRV